MQKNYRKLAEQYLNLYYQSFVEKKVKNMNNIVDSNSETYFYQKMLESAADHAKLFGTS